MDEKKSTRIWANYTSLERTQFSKQNIQITFFVWGPRGPDRALWKFGPNGEAPTIFLKFRLYSIHGHWKNLAERTPPANEPKGPWGPLEIHESWFFTPWMNQINKNLSKLYIIGKSSVFQTKYPNNFFCLGPQGPDRPFENLDPMGRPLRFSLNFVYTVYMAIGKIWLKEPHRQMSPRPLRAPRNSWIKVFAQWMNKIKKNLGKLYIIGKSSIFQTKYPNNLFVWGSRGPDRALWKFGPNGEAPTIFLKFRLYSLHGHWKNLAERTPPANEPKGPWGPLEFHESWFLPHGWKKINKNLGKLYIIGKNSIFQTKYPNNLFCLGLKGPR